MQGQLEDPAREVKRLRRCINDLVSVLALPAIWRGSRPSHILETVIDVLLRMLNLEFAYGRLDDAFGTTPIDILRVADDGKFNLPQELHKVLGALVAGGDQLSLLQRRIRFEDEEFSISQLPLGIQGEIGLIVLGSNREAFPDKTERLILSTAANQASVALQEALLLIEQKRIANELEQRVAERTSRLAAANEELRKEIAERKRIEERLLLSELDLQKAFQEIQKSEAKLRQVIDTIPTLVWSNLPDGLNEFLNKGWHEYTGLSPEESKGWGWHVALHPDDLPRFMEKRQELMASGEPGEIEARLRRYDGVYQWFLIRVGPFRDESGKIQRWYGTGTNIERRKRAEMALHEAVDERTRLAAFREAIGMALSLHEDLKSILHSCASAMVRHLDAAFARIWTLNSDGSELELRASAGIYTRLDGSHSRIPVGHLKIGLIAQEKKPHFTNDVQNDIRVSDKDWARREGMVSFAGYPLVLEDRLIGVMGMFSRKPLGESTLEALSLAAGIIAQGIERKHAEEALRASERTLRELTETIPQMLWSAETDGAIDYCNQRVLDYTGLSRQQVRGSGWMKSVHQDDVEKMLQEWTRAVSTGEPFQHEFRCRRAADNTYRWCITSALALCGQGGRVIKWFGTVVDLHDRKEAQQALQATQTELARVSRLTTMGELAASIAHEVNQPLAAVTNNSNACLRLLAVDNLRPEVLRRALEAIVADGTRASTVVANIRAFIKKAPLERNELDINDVIEEVLALANHALYENRVLLERKLTRSLPRVLADRIQMQQVLLNLIMNAIEAMGTVTNRPRSLCMQSGIDDAGDVLIAVRDSGTGFGSEAQRLFTPFFTTKANGMGMGLSISRSLVESHGGRLWAEPNSPHGAAFCFTLPESGRSVS